MRPRHRYLPAGDPVHERQGHGRPAALSDFPHRRVLIYGVTGSGKSTLAQRLGERTDLPVTLVDELTWLPGWVAVPEEEQRQRFTEIASGDQWVLDSAYSAWLDVVLPRADLVVGLDYPRWLSLQRLVRRTVVRRIDKRLVCNGNTESWRSLFSRDSIVAWHFRSFTRKRTRMRSWAAEPGGPQVLLFRRPRDLEAWLLAL